MHGKVKKCLGLVLLFAFGISHAQTYMQRQNTVFFMPDEWLLGSGQPWHFSVHPNNNGKKLTVRNSTVEEKYAIEEINKLFGNLPSKAIVLGDGNNIVHQQIKLPANSNSLFLSASIDKTITGLSAGVAVCDKKISLNTKAKELLPELINTEIGNSTLRHNLIMASGGISSLDDSQSLLDHEWKEMLSGQKSIMDFMVGRLGKSDFAPGEKFDYKSQDPFLVGMMISASYGGSGKKFRQWQNEYFWPKVGVNDRRVQGEDRFGYANSDGNTRLTLNDWAIFASFVQVSRKKTDCYGKFVKEATTTQVKNTKRFGKMYDGYGYFVWTENQQVPNSFSALGYGGQAIIWSNVNNKYFIIFSNNTSNIDIHRMARLWLESN